MASCDRGDRGGDGRRQRFGSRQAVGEHGMGCGVKQHSGGDLGDVILGYGRTRTFAGGTTHDTVAPDYLGNHSSSRNRML